ncbi:desulfoferrodoxin [Thermoanaerobacterium thermosaccharolyticum]|uniref:Desulfoferrodoxin n=1 Tax=Thermoanaerobacterium thermosaccharolyticum TaxID=1517 RepID=A0A223HYY0_THETR|nr:desulfoferrodoxin [Thermoanaerobacterium thermosaccharolyticum]AST57680.1 desulfoferrodoxin [Thermoanaerobacterium thermosaccharolyticum]
MTNLFGVYKCKECGNTVEVLNAGDGTLTCCEKPMEEQVVNTVDASKEKHVPVILRNGDTVTVKVGSVEHPMEEKHYIEWISILADGIYMRKMLKPGDKPEATFKTDASKIKAWAFCNLHGLWTSEV